MKQRRNLPALKWMIVAIVVNGLFLWKPFSYTWFILISSFKTAFTEILYNQKVVCDHPTVNSELTALQIENDALILQNEKLKQLMKISSELSHESFYAQVMHVDSTTGLICIRSDSEQLMMNQAVIASDGYLGKIVHVQGNQAIVETLKSSELTSELSVSLIGEKTQVHAMIQGTQNGFATAVLMDESMDVQEGMSVVTSPYSLFPAGIPVGKVSQVHQDFSDVKTTVFIELSASYVQYDTVCVIDGFIMQ